MEKLNKEYEEIIESLKIELEKAKMYSNSATEQKTNLAKEAELVSTDDEEK